MGMPPTGQSVDVYGVDIVGFGDDGPAREHWGVFDALGLMQQLGVVPQGAPKGPAKAGKVAAAVADRLCCAVLLGALLRDYWLFSGSPLPPCLVPLDVNMKLMLLL